jgi:hypothetical protein
MILPESSNTKASMMGTISFLDWAGPMRDRMSAIASLPQTIEGEVNESSMFNPTNRPQNAAARGADRKRLDRAINAEPPSAYAETTINPKGGLPRRQVILDMKSMRYVRG